ncbi:MAG: hypothetical protein AMXMBFR13_38640 [Phycisphaerae bacterium]
MHCYNSYDVAATRGPDYGPAFAGYGVPAGRQSVTSRPGRAGVDARIELAAGSSMPRTNMQRL